MTLVDTSLVPLPRERRQVFTASVARSFESELDVWSRIAEDGAALAFQRPAWLAPWAHLIAPAQELECLAVTVRDSLGRPIMGLPLVRQRLGLTRIGFADGGLADFNAPILAKRIPQGAAEARLIWHSVLQVLPRADVIRLERMPGEVDGIVNPLALLGGTRTARECGLMFELSQPFAVWRQALPRRYRKELSRCERLFEALPGARFERVCGDGVEVLDTLERLQRRRIAALGGVYTLNHHEVVNFYRALASDLTLGPAVLTVLRTDAGIAAALFGLRHGRRFTMLRIGIAADYARMSPGRGLIARTMEALNEDGVDTFDFGRGDYPYKRRLGGRPMELRDLVLAGSPLGLPEAAGAQLRARLRTTPRLHAAAKQLRGALLGPRGSAIAPRNGRTPQP